MELKTRVLKAHQHSTIEELNTAREEAVAKFHAESSGIYGPSTLEGRMVIHEQRTYWNTVIGALDELLTNYQYTVIDQGNYAVGSFKSAEAALTYARENEPYNFAYRIVPYGHHSVK